MGQRTTSMFPTTRTSSPHRRRRTGEPTDDIALACACSHCPARIGTTTLRPPPHNGLSRRRRENRSSSNSSVSLAATTTWGPSSLLVAGAPELRLLSPAAETTARTCSDMGWGAHAQAPAPATQRSRHRRVISAAAATHGESMPIRRNMESKRSHAARRSNQRDDRRARRGAAPTCAGRTSVGAEVFGRFFRQREGEAKGKSQRARARWMIRGRLNPASRRLHSQRKSELFFALVTVVADSTPTHADRR
jgi:hypothetical protein